MTNPRSRRPLRLGLAWLPAVTGALLLALGPAESSAQIQLFAEDFEGLDLGPPVDEPVSFPNFPNAFTHNPPPGWDRFDDVPGIGDPDVGTQEWEGWSFADIEFWQIAGDVGQPPLVPFRNFFANGFGTIAVADPDQWNDRGDPANLPFNAGGGTSGGFFNSFIQTPFIDANGATQDPDRRLKLGFDVAWYGGQCCNDGEGFNHPSQPEPFTDNQTFTIRVTRPDGGFIEVLRWEAAPLIGPDGLPTNIPSPGASPNPFFQPLILNDRIWIDLEPNQAAALGLGNSVLGGSGSGGGDPIGIEFGGENAGDDGYVAVDNIEVIEIGTVPGDMNVNGILDAGDVGAFALGLLDVTAYEEAYYFELPITRGSVDDGTFDFDDIEWFVDVMEMGGVSASVEQIYALVSAPEPSSGILLVIGALAVAGGRRAYARR